VHPNPVATSSPSTMKTALTFVFVFVGTIALAQTTDQHSYTKLVDAHLSFGFKLYRAVRDQENKSNVVLSPPSAFLALSLLQNGADDETRAEIARALEITGMSLAEVNRGNAELRHALKYPILAPPGRKAPAGTGEKLALSNLFWCVCRAFDPAFIGVNQKFYGETLVKQMSGKSRQDTAVDRWVKQATEGTITRAPRLSQFDFAVLSAAYYRGVWASPFRKEDTREADFTELEGTKEKVPMMKRTAHLPYFRGDHFEGVGLSFLNATMYVLVPDEDSSLSDLENTLDKDNWEIWMRGFSVREGTIELPRFKTGRETNLTSSLNQIGIQKAFTSLRAFAPALRLTVPGARLVKAYQQTALEVDEKGAKIVVFGVIAGVIGGVPGGVQAPPPPFHVIANRPFLFVVRDNRTGIILFFGRIVDPKATASPATVN
jgi:serine protease inhibitor